MRTAVRTSTDGSSRKSGTRWSSRRASRARLAPSASDTPSGTSTMPSAVISVGRGARWEPMRIRSRAVRGLASGMRIRYGPRRRPIRSSAGRRPLAVARPGLPGADEPRLEVLELAGLALDQPLGLLIGHLPRLVDEAGGAAEVEAGQPGQQRLAVDPGPLEGEQRVVQAADPQLGGEGERLGLLGRQGEDPFELLAGQGPLPHRALGQARRLEGIDQLGLVDRDRLGQDHPLEAVLRDRLRAADGQPRLGLLTGHPEQGAHHLAEHGPQVGGGVLGVVDLGPQPGLAHRVPAGQGVMGHPDVDPERAVASSQSV